MDILSLGIWIHITFGVLIYGVGESLNCAYPRLEDDYDSEGCMCKWEENDFYFDAMNDKYVLKPYDTDANCFEKEARRRYWEKRED